VEGTPSLPEEAPVDDLVGEGVLEGVFGLGEEPRLVEELRPLQLRERAVHHIHGLHVLSPPIALPGGLDFALRRRDGGARQGEERKVGGGRAVQHWGNLATPILRRLDLATPRRCPCIVEENDATCVVPPDARAYLEDDRNIVIEVMA
jgi:hypothetical protein